MALTLFSCDDGTDAYLVTLLDDGELAVEADQAYVGTWSAEGTTLTLSVPGLAFEESSVEAHVRYDRLVLFYTPSLECHAIALVAPAAPSYELYTLPHHPLHPRRLLRGQTRSASAPTAASTAAARDPHSQCRSLGPRSARRRSRLAFGSGLHRCAMQDIR